jgi:transposase
MPSGVYERKPWMKNSTGMKTQRDYILTLRADGVGFRLIGKMFGVSKQTVQRVVKGEWNPGRGRKVSA